MSIKYKVLKDYQFVTNDKKIVILKAKSIIVDYRYVNKLDDIILEKEVIDGNPDYFSYIDWKEELNTFIKQNKIPQPALLTKKLSPFIEDLLKSNTNSTEKIVEKVVYDEKQEIELNKIKDQLDKKEKEINKLKLLLDKKENNNVDLSEYIKLSDINQKVDDLKRQGWDMSIVEKILN